MDSSPANALSSVAASVPAGSVSLVMATYRRTHCIAETVRQLLGAQTRAPYEIIVVNNDPTPGAEDAVRAVLPVDSRVRVISCTTGKQGAARNHGLGVATGEYVAFVDDDDDYASDFIEKLAGVLDLGIRSVRCQIQSCGCAGPDCTGKPTRAHHPQTQNTMARRDALTASWGEPPNEDREYWERHPVEGAIDDCLVTTCYGPGKHSPRNREEGGGWRVHFVVTVLVSRHDARYLKPCITALRTQSYGRFTCVLRDESGDAAIAKALGQLVAGDPRFTVQRFAPLPLQGAAILTRACSSGPLQDDDVLLLLRANERLAHSGVLNQLAHVYAEQNDVWMTYGACVTEPFVPSWPQASFPPAVWRSARFRDVAGVIGEYAPFTLRAPFFNALASVLPADQLAPPAPASAEYDESDLPLFLAALELAGAAHVYPMAEVQAIKGLEKPTYKDAAARRASIARQFEARAGRPLAPLAALPALAAPRRQAETPLHRSTPLLWAGPVFDPSGYANEVRSMVLALEGLGSEPALRALGHHSPAFSNRLDVTTRDRLDTLLGRSVASDFIGVVHLPPAFLQRVKGARYMIGRTMFETDGLPAAFVASCNQMDELWVPCAFNEATFRQAGVQTHITCIPGAIDSMRFRPGLKPYPIPRARGIVFLSTIEWKPRKGWQTLIRAWSEAFTSGDDVTLVFRSSVPGQTDVDGSATIDREIDALLASMGRARADVAPIIVLGRQLADAEIPRLYAAADVYVATSSGEGWGYPYMEAMASGLPTIATRWSGNLEFMNDENSLLCEIDGLIPAHDEYVGPMPGQRWAQPSVTHLTQLLRVAIDDPARAARVAAQGRHDMQHTWTWQRSAALVRERLTELDAELSRGRTAIVPVHGSRPRVRWEGPQFTFSSLGVVNREFCAELVLQDKVDLAILPSLADDFLPDPDSRFAAVSALVRQKPSGPAQVHVAHQWPPRLEAPEHGAWVLMQPWEYGGLPGEWVSVMRDQIDELWVYCSWQRECAIQSGVPADKVTVVPIGVDPTRHRSVGDRFPLATQKKTKLLAIGGIIPRKGMDLLVETYLRTFTAADDVCLVVKGLCSRWAYHGNQGQKDFAELPALAAADGAAEIEFIGDTLDDDAIASLYRACDVLVAPFRGEGFGLPIAEAMATGLPVIVTRAGPVLDICDASTAYLIPAGQSPVSAGVAGLAAGRAGYWWADPDPRELARLMRHVVEHPEEARATGKRGQARVLEQFTYAHGVDIATQRLLELAKRTPVRDQATTPFTTSGMAYPLDQPKSMVFLHHAAWWQTEWRDVVRGFLRAFRAEDDVSLVLTLDPAQGMHEDDVAAHIAAIRGEEKLDEADAPDILLVPDELDDALLASLYRAADQIVVGARDAAASARARAVGRPVLAGLAKATWRAAAASAASTITR